MGTRTTLDMIYERFPYLQLLEEFGEHAYQYLKSKEFLALQASLQDQKLSKVQIDCLQIGAARYLNIDSKERKYDFRWPHLTFRDKSTGSDTGVNRLVVSRVRISNELALRVDVSPVLKKGNSRWAHGDVDHDRCTSLIMWEYNKFSCMKSNFRTREEYEAVVLQFIREDHPKLPCVEHDGSPHYKWKWKGNKPIVGVETWAYKFTRLL